MIFRKHKAVIAAFLSVAMTVSALATTASAAGTRTKPEKYGEDTYRQRALSLYDDVVTNGVANGYLSSQTTTGGFGIPYHSVETMIVEAPDYGHETTSEAMSYIAWIAAMHDKLLKDETGTAGTDFPKAWATMEKIIPIGKQKNFFGDVNSQGAEKIEATYAHEYQDPAEYPGMTSGAKVTNPYYSLFKTAYSSEPEKGYYLMHWLADVDDWYGYGAQSGEGAGKFTFINSFQRGEQESCWETVPHPSIDTLAYGKSGYGLIGVFSNDSPPSAQWRFTNAPDAEDRAIQAAYEANLWGVGNASVSAKAGKMSDQLRNDMFDKYYQKLGFTGTAVAKTATGTSATESMHYLMAWYTSWGGTNVDADISSYGGWKWQIGASHIHEFYQNPLAAYAKVYDSAINAGMKATNATQDWKTSLDRQLEFYEWLQSAEGPFAGGATNSFNGRYEEWNQSAPAIAGVTKKTTFYEMSYLPHPVYMDPGSNHWVGNQVWATQRLAELYYYTQVDGDKSECDAGPRLEKMLDKWVHYFVNKDKNGDDMIKINTGDEFDYAMVETFDWTGQPETWTGSYVENKDLHATPTAWASGDIGVVASMANTLIYYAAAKGAPSSAAHDESVLTSGTDAEKALYYAAYLLDRMWANLRDDIGIAAPGGFDANFIHRFFTQEVYVPASYSGTLPKGGKAQNGTTFLELRPQYKEDPAYAKVKAAYDANPELAGNSFDAETINEKIGDSTSMTYHRFWHEGDEIMALGAMALLYPDVTPPGDNDNTAPTVTPNPITVKVGQVAPAPTAIDKNDDGEETGKKVTFTIEDTTVATLMPDNRIVGEKEGTTYLIASDGKNTVKVPLTVTKDDVSSTTTTTPTTTAPSGDTLLGDVNVDGQVTISDLILLAKRISNKATLTPQGEKNAACDKGAGINGEDLLALIKYISDRTLKLPL